MTGPKRKAGDQLAESSGVGRLWVGTIFLAITTSLPELVTHLSAVGLDAQAPAGGNILGANMLNVVVFLTLSCFAPGPRAEVADGPCPGPHGPSYRPRGLRRARRPGPRGSGHAFDSRRAPPGQGGRAPHPGDGERGQPRFRKG